MAKAIELVSTVKAISVVQKAAENNETEPWLRVTLEYPLEDPSVVSRLALLKGEAVVVTLTTQQLKMGT